MHYTIYKITNNTNGKIYIGKHQTKNLEDGYMGSGKYLKRAIKKHGIENFTKEILFVLDTEEEMNYIEKQMVTLEFCESKDTYNICEGGQGGFSYLNRTGLNHSNSAFKSEKWQKIFQDKAKKSLNQKYEDPEWKERRIKQLSECSKKYYENNVGHFKGKKHTDEWKINHSKIMKEKTGDKNSQYGTMWITNGVENKKIKKTDIIPDGFRKGRVIK